MKKKHPLIILLGGEIMRERMENVDESFNEKLKTAASHSLYVAVKFSTLHYLVQGNTFSDIHKITEKYFEHFHENYDYFNERLVQREALPIRSLEEAMDYCTKCFNTHTKNKGSHNVNLTKDTNDKFRREPEKEKYTIAEACECILHLLMKCRKFSELLKKQSAMVEDYVTEDRMVDELTWLDKQIWMVKSRLAANQVN